MRPIRTISILSTVCLSVCLSVYLSVCLFVCRSRTSVLLSSLFSIDRPKYFFAFFYGLTWRSVGWLIWAVDWAVSRVRRVIYPIQNTNDVRFLRNNFCSNSGRKRTFEIGAWPMISFLGQRKSMHLLFTLFSPRTNSYEVSRQKVSTRVYFERPFWI